MRAREVNRKIERLGGQFVRQTGSERRYTARATLADGTEIKAVTSVPQHPGDIPRGTLRAIEKQMEPVFGERWLTK